METRTDDRDGRSRSAGRRIGLFPMMLLWVQEWLMYRRLQRQAARAVPRADRARFAVALRAERRLLMQRDGDMMWDLAARHHRRLTASVLAVQRALIATGVARVDAVAAIGAALTAIATRATPWIRRDLDRCRDPFTRLVQISKRKEGDYYGATFSFERPRDDDGTYDLRVERCFYNDYFRRHDAAELAVLFCEFDRAWTDAIAPRAHGVSFTRPTTLARDEQPCRFLFERTGA